MKRNNWLKRILIGITAVSLLGLLSINFIKHNEYIYSNDRAFFSFFSMLRYSLIDNPIESIARISEDIATSWDLRHENDLLRQQLEAAAHNETYIKELEDEIESLKELVALDSTYTEYTMIPCTVKNRSMSSWDKTIVINVGSDDGVEVDDGVMSAKGVVGRVIEVSPKQSVVSLLSANDDNSSVALKIRIDKTTSVLGVLDNYDTSTNLFSIRLLDNSASLIPGMKISTSGLGGIYPAGLYLGEIKEVENVADGIGVAVWMEASVNFDDLRYLVVVK